jgi:hypothetical protein
MRVTAKEGPLLRCLPLMQHGICQWAYEVLYLFGHVLVERRKWKSPSGDPPKGGSARTAIWEFGLLGTAIGAILTLKEGVHNRLQRNIPH